MIVLLLRHIHQVTFAETQFETPNPPTWSIFDEHAQTKIHMQKQLQTPPRSRPD